MKFKKILSFFLAVLCCFSFLIPSAFAAEKSAIEQELENVIDLADYPANAKDTGVYLITLMEKGYNGSGYDSDAGIYVYLYNPSKKEVGNSHVLNQISFASKLDAEGMPINPVKKDLLLIEGAKDGVLLKFKVAAKPSELVINTSDVRHYAVSEIELFEDGHYNTNAQAYTCGYDFAFTGSGEALLCERTSFLTIELDVKSTSYITGDSALGQNYSNMISSVYFSVPKAIEAKYGNLYSIDYMAEKYYTAPMILIEKKYEDVLEVLSEKIGMSSETARLKFWIGRNGIGNNLNFDYGFGYSDVDIWFENGYKKEIYDNKLPFYTTYFGVNTLESNTLVVSSDQMLTYFVDYSEGRRNLIRDVYSVNLFKSTNGEPVGGTIDRTQWGNLPSYEDTHEWYEGVRDYGLGYLWNKDKHDDTIEAKMIESIDLSDFGSSSFCEKFLVSEMDVDDLKSYVSKATANGQNTYLFRFAFDNDYYAAEGVLSVLSEKNDNVLKSVDINGVVTPVYLGFDIFQLTFSDNGEDLTTFMVVSSPIDVVPDLSTSDDDNDTDDLPTLEVDWTWLKLLIGAFVGLFVLYVFINVANWFLPSKKKQEERIVIQMPAQPRPPSPSGIDLEVDTDEVAADE